MNPDKIHIQGLQFRCIIGIYPHERERAQTLRVDLCMETDTRAAAETGDLNQTLNYAEISERVIQFCTLRQAELLETLAEELASLLLDSYQMNRLTLKMIKPEAVAQAEGVGIEITRDRSVLADHS